MQEARQTQRLEPKIYLIPTGLRLLFLVPILMFIGLMSGPIFMYATLLSQPFTSLNALYLLFWTIVLFLIIAGLGMIYAQSKQSLELSQEGILYIGADFQLYTPWSNLAGLGAIKYPFHTLRTLELKEVPLRNISLSEGKRQKKAVLVGRRWQPLARYRISFPLGIIPPKAWKDGDFSSTLQRFFAASEGYPITVSTEASVKNEIAPVMNPWVWLMNIGPQVLIFIAYISVEKNWLSLLPVSLTYMLMGLVFYLFTLRRIHNIALFFQALSLLIGLLSAGILALGLTYFLTNFLLFDRVLLFFLIFLPLLVCLALMIWRRIKKVKEFKLKQAASFLPD